MSDQSRASAWHVVHWAEQLHVRDILIENVPEFMQWGPLDDDGRPIKDRRGDTFRAFVKALESLNYRVEFRTLVAADYGDPTTRRRFFLRARLGCGSIEWPEPTHAKDGEGDLAPWRTAREIIDWTDLGESIFRRRRPLAERTIARIAEGIRRFCGDHAEPFLVMLYGTGTVRSVDRPAPTVTAKGEHVGLATPFLVKVTHGDRPHAPRSPDLPLTTVTTKNGFGLVRPFLLPHDQFVARNGLSMVDSVEDPMRTVKAGAGAAGNLVVPFIVPHFGERPGQQPRTHSIDEPSPTVTATKGAGSLVTPFLVPYYGTGVARDVEDPVGTVTTKDRFALVSPERCSLDIFFRMLKPVELARAQGFPDTFRFTGTKTETVRQIGNAIPVGTAEELCYSALNSKAA